MGKLSLTAVFIAGFVPQMFCRFNAKLCVLAEVPSKCNIFLFKAIQFYLYLIISLLETKMPIL